VDRNANASSWRITVTPDGGVESTLASGTLSPPSSGGTITVERPGAACPGSTCVTTSFTVKVIVTDATGLTSTRAYVDLTVLGTGAAASLASGGPQAVNLGVKSRLATRLPEGLRMGVRELALRPADAGSQNQ
jgi:hypothetical protein